MDKYESAVSMYEQGLSVGKVAEYYGVTRQSMWKILLRRGAKMRDKRRSGSSNGFYRGYNLQSKRASHMVEMAIEKGILYRQPCEKCGTEDDLRAHHDDYNKPLEVRWLCGLHHYEWHEKNTPIPLAAPLPRMNAQEIASMAGKASAAKLTSEQRSERGRHACDVRWHKS